MAVNPHIFRFENRAIAIINLNTKLVQLLMAKSHKDPRLVYRSNVTYIHRMRRFRIILCNRLLGGFQARNICSIYIQDISVLIIGVEISIVRFGLCV